MRDLEGKGLLKLDRDQAMNVLDVGVLTVRDMVIAENATFFETCVGSRILDCKGCMSGISRFDGAIEAARRASNLHFGRQIFRDPKPVSGKKAGGPGR